MLAESAWNIDTASAFGNCQSRVLIHAKIKEVPKYLN